MLKRIVRRAFGREGEVVQPYFRMHPQGNSQGKVLLSFSTHVYQRLVQGETMEIRHPSGWTNISIATAFLEMGFTVDAIDYYRTPVALDGAYDVALDCCSNLGVIEDLADSVSMRLFFTMFAHPLVNNTNVHKRSVSLLQRRHQLVRPTRLLEVTDSPERADHLLTTGGPYSSASYAHLAAQEHRISQVHPYALNEPLSRDYDQARNHFLWLGGTGALLKGLDLALEAFADLPDYHLHICTDLSAEAEFVACYREELDDLPNVHVRGFVDTNSVAWRDLSQKCSGALFTSATEARATSVVSAMLTGLIPICTHGTDYSDLEFVETIAQDTPEAVKQAVLDFADQPGSALKNQSTTVFEWVNRTCGRELAKQDIRDQLAELLGVGRPDPCADWIPSELTDMTVKSN